MNTAHVEIIRLLECDSTQQEARKALVENPSARMVVVSAETQRAGHGRQGRSWQTPADDALLLSIAWRSPKLRVELEDLVTQIGAMIIEQLEQNFTLAHGTIVWKEPNDFMHSSSQQKLGGVLIDITDTAGSIEQLVLGVGINLRGAAFTLTDSRNVTTLEAIGAKTFVDSKALANLVAEALDRELFSA